MNRERSYGFIKRVLLCGILFIVCCSGVLQAGENMLQQVVHTNDAAEGKRLAIFFTNDIHSSGDYARMAALIERERNSLQQRGYPVIVVDAGDIAMGSVFHTIYSSHAFEYTTLGKMGYDAYTFGNHDFDFGLPALYQMFGSVADSLKTPALLCANLTAAYNSQQFNDLTGVKDTLVLRRFIGRENESKQEIRIGLFGLMGDHAYSCIVCKDSLVFTDRMEAARKSIAALQNAGANYIIALSHGGTLWADGKKIPQTLENWQQLKAATEDGILAHELPQINAIISGHDHEEFPLPLIYGHTVIASTGTQNSNLGKLLFNGDSLVGYELLPVTESIEPNQQVSEWVAQNYKIVEEKFYAAGNLNLDDTIAYLPQTLDLDIQPDGNLLLGQLIAESYRWAMDSECISMVPYGIIRRELEKGYITNHDIFDVLPLGIAPNGAPGYPLVQAYLTGAELEDICELNASVAGGMEDARLFFSGMSFEYNSYKIPFTRVTKVFVNGEPVVKDKLYPVVTGMYTAQLMGMLKSSSFGLLSVQPKDSAGNPIEDLNSIILKKSGKTEWLAFAEYAKETELKNLNPESCSVDASTPLIYLKYLAVAILLVLLLWSGKRLLYRQP